VRGLVGAIDHKEWEDEGNEGGDDHEKQVAHKSTQMTHAPNLQVRGKWLPKTYMLFAIIYKSKHNN
jgi:hypothetical protein